MEPSLNNPDAATEPAKPAPWLSYSLPMLVFLGLTQGEAIMPESLYPALYAVKAVIVTATLVLCANAWRHELRFDRKAVLFGGVVGLVGLPLWLGVDAVTPPLSFLGTRSAYNPFQQIEGDALRAAFLVVRFFGLAVMVPVMEEVFWRSFLLRFVTDQDRWDKIAIGTFSVAALAVTCALFGAAHSEYLAAIVFALLMAGLLRQTKSLLACVVAHAVTNVSLGVYVLATGQWRYW